MRISSFGTKIAAGSGISLLMADLGAARTAGSERPIMLGGGNPRTSPPSNRPFDKA